MTNLKNQAVRFGLDETTGQLFDYLTSTYIPADAVTLNDPDGQWDLAKLKEQLSTGQAIHASFTTLAHQSERELAFKSLTEANDLLQEANQSFIQKNARIEELERENAALAANLQEADHRLMQAQTTDRKSDSDSSDPALRRVLSTHDAAVIDYGAQREHTADQKGPGHDANGSPAE